MIEPASGGDAGERLAVEPAVDYSTPLYTRDFWLVFAASFTLNSATNLFVLFPLFVMRLGGSASVIGVIMGTGWLAALMVRPAVGPGIDSFGRKWMVLWFLVLAAIATALYIPIASLGWPILAVRALQGAAEGTARVALFAFVYEILPPGREGEGMAIFSICGMAPAALAPLIGEELIKRRGFGAFFAAAIALYIVAAIATLGVPDNRSRRVARPAIDPQVPSYTRMILDRGLMPLWIVTLLFSLALSSRLSFVAPWAYQEGIGRVGWYFAIYSGAAIALRLFSARGIDQVGPEKVLFPSLIVLSVGLAMLALIGHRGMLEVAALIGGVGHGYVYPSLSALVIERSGQNAMGRSSAIYTSLYDFGAMAGPWILGAMAEGIGYAWMFVASGTFALMAAVYFARVEPGVLARRLG
ncbi:MAG: MFS transporter [Candidatus Binataceae bacterium]